MACWLSATDSKSEVKSIYGICMGKKEQVSNKQLGFYLSKNGEKLRIHADTGDRMIRPPRPRHRRTGSTPYKEVQAYMRELKSWEAGAGQVSTVNDNGGGTIFDVDLHWVRVSPVGEEGDPHSVEVDAASSRPLFENLSPKAQALFWALKNRGKKE